MSRLGRWKEPARSRVLRGVKRVMLLVVCVLAGCGASSERHATRTNAVRPPLADAPAITTTLTAVFVHPEASQCSTATAVQLMRP